MGAKTCLNPDAPTFVPSAFLAVDDFSPQWYRLVQSSPAFRQYWLRDVEAAEEFAEDCGDEYEEIDLGFPALRIVVPALIEDPEEKTPHTIAEVAAAAKPEDLKPFLLLQEEEVPPKTSRRNKGVFFNEKPPKIVHEHLKKSATRRINQPR